jgi:hypothetical protein
MKTLYLFGNVELFLRWIAFFIIFKSTEFRDYDANIGALEIMIMFNFLNYQQKKIDNKIAVFKVMRKDFFVNRYKWKGFKIIFLT